MSQGWTPERRAKQAEAIRPWKPWDRSTEPETEEGKAASSRNADKGGTKSKASLQLLGQLLREQKEALEECPYQAVRLGPARAMG